MRQEFVKLLLVTRAYAIAVVTVLERVGPEAPVFRGDVRQGLAVERRRLYDDSRHLGVFSHTYQPPRAFQLVSQASGARADIVGSVNGQIHEESYKPVFIDRGEIPRGMIFSLYGTLRQWMAANKPEDFATLVENVHKLGGDAKWRVLADPFLHLIMPLESRDTQNMLVQTGLAAFEKDLGFRPKGFWLPETAVSKQTLEVLAQNGIEFVVLRDSQVGDLQGHRTAYANLGRDDIKIAVVAVDSEISGSVSFEDYATWTAEGLLQRFAWKHDISFATDTEFYGHHMKGKDAFLHQLTREDVQTEHGLIPINMEVELANLEESPRYVDVFDNSSWSDEPYHNLGRWTGECWCGDGNTEDTIAYKKELWGTISGYGREIDHRLDAADPNWRAKFPDFFEAIRQSMYGEGDFHQAVARLSRQHGFEVLRDSNVRALYLAEIARLTGTTSCFNFFGGGPDRVERQIARLNIGEIESLIPDIGAFRHLNWQQAA